MINSNSKIKILPYSPLKVSIKYTSTTYKKYGIRPEIHNES